MLTAALSTRSLDPTLYTTTRKTSTELPMEGIFLIAWAGIIGFAAVLLILCTKPFSDSAIAAADYADWHDPGPSTEHRAAGP